MTQNRLTPLERSIMLLAYLLIAIALLTLVPGWPTIIVWLSKDGAPAWIQAIGSIGAIAAAIWIGHANDRARTRTALDHYIAYKVAVRDNLTGAISACSTHNWSYVALACARMRAAEAIGQRIDIGALETRHVLAVVGFIGIVAESIEVMTVALRQSQSANSSTPHLEGLLNQMLARLNKTDSVHWE